MNSMYYNNLSTNHSKINQNLFDVNKQIASGLKIQYASDDVATFVETMRLDNEITTLGQISKSAESGYKVSNQTDATLNEFTNELERMKVLLIQATNDTNNDVSLDAIARELRAVEGTLQTLANTSVNGKYLFSGSAVNIKPIDDNGKYQGNDSSMNALLGSNNEQAFNVSGAQLFLGEETLTRREITANVIQTTVDGNTPTGETSMEEFMGTVPAGTGHNFYLRGARSDGTSFSTQIKLNNTSTVGDLMDEIGKSYSNSGSINVVNVSMNDRGQITVSDKSSGSSKLEFHMIGASAFGAAIQQLDTVTFSGTVSTGDTFTWSDGVTGVDLGPFTLTTGDTPQDIGDLVAADIATKPALDALYTVVSTPSGFTIESKTVGTAFSGTATYTPSVGSTAEVQSSSTDLASVSSIDDLVTNGGLTDYNAAQASADQLFIREFNQSPYEVADGVSTLLSGRLYDRTEFTQTGSSLTSSIPQVNKTTNAFALPSTKISEVADLTQGTAGTLDGTQLILNGKDINGASFTPVVQIDFKSTANGGSTFSLDGGVTNYEIFDMNVTRAAVNADDMTYQQLTDVINMVISGTMPTTPGSADAYDAAIMSSYDKSNTYLEGGKITILDKTSSTTKASISLYDSNSGSFVNGESSAMTFNSNNSLTVRDPKTDFFASISEAIRSVEEYKVYPDTSSGTIRNLGMENSIALIGDLQNHLFKVQSIAGAQSSRLTSALENTEILALSTKILRSEVIDTDLAEAALRLQQLTLNQQAMLSTVGKVAKLSLVNYL